LNEIIVQLLNRNPCHIHVFPLALKKFTKIELSGKYRKINPVFLENNNGGNHDHKTQPESGVDLGR
jgi:hypothetical protein